MIEIENFEMNEQNVLVSFNKTEERQIFLELEWKFINVEIDEPYYEIEMEILDCFEIAGEIELNYILTTEELDSLEIILADEINGEALFEKYLESEKDYQDELRFEYLREQDL
jgi:hypothetical protein